MPKPAVIRKGPPNPPRLRRLSIRARRWWSAWTLRRRKRAWRAARTRPAEKIVAFILGCQRSGTNMLLRTLDRMMEVDRFDEDDPRAFVNNRIRPREVRDRLIAASDAACVLFKPICDSHRALDLLREHPGAKILWIYRHFADVAASAVHYWGDLSRLFMTDLLAGGGDWNEFQWNREGVTEELLAPLRAAAKAPLTDMDSACLFWYLRNQFFFTQMLQIRPDTLLIRYESLVKNPRKNFDNLCSFLNLQLDPQSVSRVHAESVGRGAPRAITPDVYMVCEGLLAELDAVAGEGPSGAGAVPAT